MSTCTINVTGTRTLHRLAELCTVNFDVTDTSQNKAESTAKVMKTANEISAVVRSLAPLPLQQNASMISAMSVEQADQSMEERETDKPVAKWTMARLNVRSFVPYSPDPDPPRKHAATVTFRVTFRDFAKMEGFVSELVHTDHVEVGSFNWDITRRTRQALQTAVRQAALREAHKKAADYAAVYTNAKLKPIVIDDDLAPSVSSRSAYSNEAACFAMARDADDNQNDPILSFEPEEISVSNTVSARFVVEF